MNGATIMRLGASFLLIGAIFQPAWAGRVPGSGLVGSAHDFTRMVRLTSETAKPTGTCIFCHSQDSSAIQNPDAAAMSGGPGYAARSASFVGRAEEQGGTPLWNPALTANFNGTGVIEVHVGCLIGEAE